jgi:hypothetical protein
MSQRTLNPRSNGNDMGHHLSTWAAGFKRHYRSDEEEVAVAFGENLRKRGGTGDPSDPQLFWWPTTVDFREQAMRRPKAVPVYDFHDLLDAIRRMRELENVHWFGHGAQNGELQFGNRHNFGPEQLAALKTPDVSSSFVPGGVITFYGCNAAFNGEFFQAIANALRVNVCGFKKGVRWEIRSAGESPRRRIVYRGVLGGKLPEDPVAFQPG